MEEPEKNKDILPEEQSAESGGADVVTETSKKHKGFFATFYKRSLTERFLLTLFATVSVLVLLTLVLICLSVNNVFPEDMNKFDDGGGHMNWYGYIIAVSIILCIVPLMYSATRQGYYTDIVFDYVIFAVPCAFIGAVLYFAVSNGFKHGESAGLGVIGGLLGAVVGLIIAMIFWQRFMHKPKVSIAQMLDVAAPLTLLGQCLGRFACYAGHCCYGITVEWNVFPFSYSYDGVTYHLGNPFIEAMCSFVGFVVLFSLSLSKKKSFNGCILSLYCIWYGVERCIIEQFRAPGQKLLLTGGHGEGFGMSQFTSLLIAAFGVIWIAQYIVRAKIAKKKLMIFVDKDKLSDEYFEYGKTIYAHPHVDEEGRPIKSDPVAAAETEEKGQ